MPIATPDTYRAMLDAAHADAYAFPAINVTSSETLNAPLTGFAEAESDGIIQVSTGGGEFASGQSVKDMALGAAALAEYAYRVADRYPVNVALHTDHCPADKLDAFMRPLLAISEERRAAGQQPLFQSHMFDGSALPLDDNLKISEQLLEQCSRLNIVLEIEAGVVGGEEDGVDNEGVSNEKLYTTPEDMLVVAQRLGTGDRGRYLLAATFGNVHGVYKPGNVKLRPSILRDGQAAVTARHGESARFQLVFHGGSGSALQEIRETLDYGVVKMNIDTDTQYAFSRAIAGHMFTNYDGVLKIDGDVGSKKVYDPRVYMKKAETKMAERVALGCADLRSSGKTLARSSR